MIYTVACWSKNGLCMFALASLTVVRSNITPNYCTPQPKIGNNADELPFGALVESLQTKNVSTTGQIVPNKAKQNLVCDTVLGLSGRNALSIN